MADAPLEWTFKSCNYPVVVSEGGPEDDEREMEKAQTEAPAGLRTQDSLCPSPTPNVTIEMAKPFLHANPKGWCWHKTWTIPKITVTLDVRQLSITLSQDPSSNISGTMHAVKLLATKTGKEYLKSVGLKGITYHKASYGKLSFSGVKFVDTSYNHEVSPVPTYKIREQIFIC